ncbi:Myb/SANT-like domain-containing protein, partial [Lactarius sanguifluus]
WSEADKATLVHTLASEKAKSNWGDNGPKKVAWTACEVALLGSEKTSGGTPKTIQSTKNRWQRIKQEFETVKELRGLSGFGWDDAKKMVTATDEVWEAYLAVSQPS